MKSSMVISALFLLVSSVHATSTHENSESNNSLNLQNQEQAQIQAQVQFQQQMAKANAESNSAANSASNATGGNASATGGTGYGGSGIGNVEGDQNTYRSSAWALTLPGLVAAPAVPGQCLEHLRGWGAASIGATGRTKLNDACVKMVNCFALADRFASWGKIDLAVAQLASCGAVSVPLPSASVTVVTPPVIEETIQVPVDSVTHEEMREYVGRAFRTSQSK